MPGLLRDVDVYKSAHHGSENGDSPASIAAWQPETTVISVGEDNIYGHPKPETLALYESAGAEVLDWSHNELKRYVGCDPLTAEGEGQSQNNS